MVVDIGSETIIERVHPSDAGSGPAGSVGSPSTEEGCAESIDKRTTSNEWCVRNYVPIGIFILPPIYVPTVVQIAGEPTRVEKFTALEAAIEPFPGQRIFSADKSSFWEFDRLVGAWKRITYDEVIPR
jgi:hypothetical protein